MPDAGSSLSFRPLGDPRRQRCLLDGELAAVYGSAECGPDSVLRWDRREASVPRAAVIVWLVGDEYCLIVLRTEMVDHFLMEPGPLGEGTMTVAMQGARVAVPCGAVLPRDRGLQVLRGVGDLALLQTSHMWRKVPRWSDDPRHARLGDLVEDLMDAAFDLVMADPGGDPVGLRHLGNLMLMHNEVMSGGVGKVGVGRSPQFAEAAAAGADYLGLPDLAATIRRIHTDADPDYQWRLGALYHAYSGPFGDDAGTIRAAVASRIDAARAEFGLQPGDTTVRHHGIR